MPSPSHDALVQLFSDRPQLVTEILRDLIHAQLPDTAIIQEEERTFNTRISEDIEPDLVFTMGPKQSPVHVIIGEVQQDNRKDAKQLARYAAAAWLMLKCDVTVLVVCPHQSVADHYAKPVQSGLNGYRFQARVAGPRDIPAIIDPQEAAADLPLAVMSVMTQGNDRKVVEAFAAALNTASDEHATKYYEYAYSMSGPETQKLLEEIMASTAWPVHSPFAREHFGRGREEGKAEEAAKSVLLVLQARGFDIPDDTRTMITTCTDLTQLHTWLTRAATAHTPQDLFTEPNQQHHQGDH
ncbi:hypothetical protein [Nonomuraea rubra]|uniref:Rpn family recombination-promoting nuclease/putative transposase n=1 Tax=Nonomuraea rubra TaxID=46180 RepID=A0A7X0P2D4_9ACTN|nr:hypothetical protein [Nonomuraea rubra]MBB6553912.1 hypothetical protein [Nonomuraea rubra]